MTELQKALQQAKAALAGDSNDADHSALHRLVGALGVDPMPDCDCDDRSWYGDEHDSACPVTGWLNTGELRTDPYSHHPEGI